MAKEAFSRDVDWNDSNLFGVSGGKDYGSNNRNARQRQSGVNKYNLFDYLSTLQTLSVQEKVMSEGFDKNLFTISQSLNGFFVGLKSGLFMNILILGYLISYIFIASSTPKISAVYDYVIIHSWLLLMILVTVWLGLYSRFAVGDLTKRMIHTLYVGKMVSSLFSGFVIVLLFVVFKGYITSGEYVRYIAKVIDIPYILAHYEHILFMLIVSIAISSFFAFFFFHFRNYLISGDMKNEYEQY